MNYRNARQQAIARDRCCVVCQTAEQLTTHHKVPRAISRNDSPANLITLCRAHHLEVEELDLIDSYMSWEPYYV